MSSQTVCVCVWGGIWSSKNASLFHVPHCLTIIVWKSAQYGNMAPGQQTQKPPRTPGPEAGAGICWTPKPKPADISAEGNLVCLCSSSFPFPILGGSVFAPRSNLIWEKLCLHGIRIYYSNWGGTIPANLRECMFFITSCEKLCCKHRSASKWSCLPSFAPSITGSANQKDRLVF